MHTRDDPELQAYDAVNRISREADSLLAIADDCEAVGMTKLAERIAHRAQAIAADAKAARDGMSRGLRQRSDESRKAVGDTLLLLLDRAAASASTT